ncbi:MAG: hypothetical protein EHM41_00075 [Chloroflexi bacterium]|nr:MAG: hypothetical protein EHM41_00075 [Chloroflexota bacterium]
MVKYDSNGRWKWILSGGTIIVVITFVGSMWYNTKSLAEDMPACKAQIAQSMVDIQISAQKNAEQDEDLLELKQLQKETLKAFNDFQIENAKQQGEIMAFIKSNTRQK